MKVWAFIIGLFILSISSIAYVKLHETACEKSCCHPSEKKSNSHNSCCGSICSPFMKCQSTNVSLLSYILPTGYPTLIEHHSALSTFFVVQLNSDMWRPPKTVVS